MEIISRRRMLFSSLAGLPLAAVSCRQAQEAKRPNILFIMTDDHSSNAISCYGSKVNETPHLDRIASEGMRMDRVFATNAICTPSRATILTGKYSHLNGVPVFNGFDGSQPTVAKMMQKAGYHTAMIGKWHLGSEPTGFDYWNILPGQGVYNDPVLYDANGSETYPGYATDVITDLGINFMKTRPADKPFFLMLHHKAPHRSWVPDEKYRKMFENKHIPEPANLRDDYATRTDAIREQEQSVFHDLIREDLKLTPPPGLTEKKRADWLGVKPTEVEIEVGGVKKTLKGKELEDWKYQRYMQNYLACVQSVDDNVGRTLDWLDANGLRDNTVVIYTSDQGFFLGEHGLYDKRFMYEESLRMPFLVRWPGTVPAGGASSAIGINCDFAPTFLDLAREPVPADMQGRSFVPIWKGGTPSDWRDAMYYRYYHDPGHHNTRAHYGIRTATHKLIYFWTKDQWECYDLVADPHEMNNIYASSGILVATGWGPGRGDSQNPRVQPPAQHGSRTLRFGICSSWLGRRIVRCRDATRAPFQGPAPRRGVDAILPLPLQDEPREWEKSATRDWPESEKSWGRRGKAPGRVATKIPEGPHLPGSQGARTHSQTEGAAICAQEGIEGRRSVRHGAAERTVP